jgi:hypothetical protein
VSAFSFNLHHAVVIAGVVVGACKTQAIAPTPDTRAVAREGNATTEAQRHSAWKQRDEVPTDDRAADAGGHSFPKTNRLAVLVLTSVRGFLEPCGCQSKPLGGVDYLGALHARLRESFAGVEIVSAGDALFDGAPLTQHSEAQAKLKAETAFDILSALGVKSWVIGEGDLAAGERFLVERLKLTRPLLRDAITRIGPATIRLFHGSIAEARALAQKGAGANFVVAGHNAALEARAEAVGGSFILQAGQDLKHVGLLTLTETPGATRFVDLSPPDPAEIELVEKKIVNVRDRLRAARREGRIADAASLQEKLDDFENRLRSLEAERRAAARAQAPPPDAHGFTYELIPLERTGPKSSAVAEKLALHNRRVGEINVAHFATVKLPKPKRGEAVVVKGATCAGCHPDEHAQWQTTAHARAWKTLTAVGKEHDGDCVSCHVTAYMAPKGAKIGATDGLTDVQCEACHGPGSLHAAQPKAKGRIACKVGKERCAPCHTPEHSDRFDFALYTKQTLAGAHGDKPCSPIRR